MFDLSDPTIRTFLIMGILTLPLKIVSIWKAAQNNQKVWFGLFFVVNTFGILELTYIFYLSKPKQK